jgi:hypothetical protein
MNKKIILLSIVLLAAVALTVSGCGKKTTTSTTNTAINTNTVVTEAPYTMVGGSKVFNLQLIDGLMNYKTMTFHAGDLVEVRLTSNGQPVDFMFQEVSAAASTNGVFGTKIENNDQGGTYHLICKTQSCGSITLTVIPNTTANTNTAANTNQSANTNSTPNKEITKVELQRIPVGTTFSPTNTYAATTEFQVGDQFGMSVTSNFIVGTKLAHSITDSTGAEVESQTQHADLRAGSNGSCCYSLPATAGSYNLKLFIDGTAAETVPFTVR